MPRRVSHWSARYLVDRIGQMTYQRRNPENPWLTPAAVDLLDSTLNTRDVGLEIGSGRSTIWFAKRLAYLISLETSARWFRAVQEETAGCGNVDLRLVPDPEDLITAIDELPVASLDFCLIDGAERDRAAIAALPKMRPNGLFVVDDIERYLASDSRSPAARGPADGASSSRWQEFSDNVSDWRRYWSSNGVSDTCIWFVPGRNGQR